jgi:hypothetical protein
MRDDEFKEEELMEEKKEETVKKHEKKVQLPAITHLDTFNETAENLPKKAAMKEQINAKKFNANRRQTLNQRLMVESVHGITNNQITKATI